MHFKRKKAKNARSGCLLCKPHKMNGFCASHKNMRISQRKKWEAGTSQMRAEGLN